jgi:hypothetical protein
VRHPGCFITPSLANAWLFMRRYVDFHRLSSAMCCGR